MQLTKDYLKLLKTRIDRCLDLQMKTMPIETEDLEIIVNEFLAAIDEIEKLKAKLNIKVGKQ